MLYVYHGTSCMLCAQTQHHTLVAMLTKLSIGNQHRGFSAFTSRVADVSALPRGTQYQPASWQHKGPSLWASWSSSFSTYSKQTMLLAAVGILQVLSCRCSRSTCCCKAGRQHMSCCSSMQPRQPTAAQHLQQGQRLPHPAVA